MNSFKIKATSILHLKICNSFVLFLLFRLSEWKKKKTFSVLQFPILLNINCSHFKNRQSQIVSHSDIWLSVSQSQGTKYTFTTWWIDVENRYFKIIRNASKFSHQHKEKAFFISYTHLIILVQQIHIWSCFFNACYSQTDNLSHYLHQWFFQSGHCSW